MGRVSDILTRARDSLADPKKERWSDDRLLRLLDEAQKDFARQSQLLKGYTTIPIVPYTATYSLPEDCWRITRAHYAEQVLRLASHASMDAIDLGWYTETGSTVEALVFDLRNDSTIRCYPMPDDSVVEQHYTFSPDTTGVVTALEGYTLSSDFGVVTGFTDSTITTEQFNSLFGVLVDVQEAEGNIAIFYIRDPKSIRAETDDLELSPRWDVALRHYVVGHAFLDDLDTQYQARGATSLTLYDRELALALRSGRLDSTEAQIFGTSYSTGFN